MLLVDEWWITGSVFGALGADAFVGAQSSLFPILRSKGECYWEGGGGGDNNVMVDVQRDLKVPLICDVKKRSSHLCLHNR